MQVQQNVMCALSANQDSKKKYCWLYILEQGTSSTVPFNFAFIYNRIVSISRHDLYRNCTGFIEASREN
jgi:hypothetical protein